MNRVTPIKCTGLKCPMQAGKVDPATCKAADTCAWATKPLTNADKIRTMTDEKLADWIMSHDCKTNLYGYLSREETLDWLKQEVKENELRCAIRRKG